LAPTLKWLSEQYGIAVFPISLDGGGLPEFPQPSRDNGMAAALGVSVVPLVVLGNVKDRRLLPIGSGVLSAQEIVERIYILTQTRPGELY
jgi:conjugal transfer pilus assembly protein TraF